MVITELGMVTDVSLLQSENLLLIDYQYFAAKKVEKWIYCFNLYSERVRFNVFNFYL